MGLIHWWPLNGDLHDQGSSPITLNNSGATVNNSGKIGKCYSFASTSQYCYTSSADNSIFASKGSLACWVKLPSSTSSYTQVLVIGTSGTSWTNIRFGIDINTSGVPYFNISNGSSNSTMNTGTALSLNEWHHLAVTFDGTNMKMYVDGVLKASSTSSFLPTLTSTQIFVGGNSGGERLNGGYMNDVRIYNHALAAAEVSDLASALVLHYPLNGNGFGDRVPVEYQRVEYIEGTGTQLINIGPHGRSHHLVDMQFTTTSGRQLMGIGGHAVEYWGRNDSSFEKCAAPSGTAVTDRILVHYDVGLIKDQYVYTWIEGATTKYEGTTDTFNTEINSDFYLFCLGSSYYFNVAKMYSYKITKANGQLSFNGIPCYRKSDGKPGMWDTVSNTFKVNAGSGEFLLGPSVGVPVQYQQVEYIEHNNNVTSSLRLQYVKTNITWNNVKKVEFIMMPFRNSYNNHIMLLSNDGWNACWVSRDSSTWQNGSNFSGLTFSPSVVPALNTKATVTISGFSTSSTVNLQFGSWSNTTWSGGWRNYSTRIYGSSAVLGDFIPCYRKSDGMAGMYNVINNTFYTNADTSSDPFWLGPSTGLPERYRQVEYLENTRTSGNIPSYINLNHTFNWTNARIDVIHQTTTRGNEMLIATGSDSYYGWIYDYGNSGISFYAKDSGGTQRGINSSFKDTNRHQTMWKNKHFYIDGGDVGNLASYTFGQGTVNLTMYAYYPGDSTYPYVGKIFSAKISENGSNNMHDLVPAYDTVSNVYGFYDLCSGKMFTNAGSGSFTAGPFTGFTQVVVDPWAKELDISGYHNNGTWHGSQMLCGDTVRYNVSSYFNGSMYIMGDNLLGAKPTDYLSISVWIKDVNTNTTGNIVSSFEGGGAGIYFNNSTQYRFQIYANGGYHSVASTALSSLKTWHHLVGVYDRTTIKIYVDGVLNATTTWGGYDIAYNSATPWAISVNPSGTQDGGEHVTGLISDVRIYATALSQAQVTALYNQRNDN